jgi:hypothetical protein
MLHTSWVPLETKKICSEAFPDGVDNKGVIRGDNFKWFILHAEQL